DAIDLHGRVAQVGETGGIWRALAVRLGGLALHLGELLVLQRVFPGVELLLALGVANAFRLVPRRGVAVAVLATAVCLAVLRLRGGGVGAIELYAIVCGARLAVARSIPFEAGLAPGALVTHAYLLAGASAPTLATVHLFGTAAGAALSWSRGVDPAR